jgi:putative acetyltransferase
VTDSDIIYKLADSKADFESGQKLFKEYAASLGVDLSFQGFDAELENVHLQYSAPAGALLLAMNNGLAIGCTGIRQLDAETAELKRMYVQDEYRGLGIGMALLKRSMQRAKELGYKKMRLDTLKNMTKAQELYSSFGFYEIPSYRFNPLEGTIYMEKKL